MLTKEKTKVTVVANTCATQIIDVRPYSKGLIITPATMTANIAASVVYADEASEANLKSSEANTLIGVRSHAVVVAAAQAIPIPEEFLQADKIRLFGFNPVGGAAVDQAADTEIILVLDRDV